MCIAVATSTVLAAAVLTAVPAAAASAAPARATVSAAPAATTASEDCPVDRLCLWMDSFFRNRMIPFNHDAWVQLSGFGFNDEASSWLNRTGREACLAWDWPAGPRRITIPKNSAAARMGVWSDKASAVRSGPC